MKLVVLSDIHSHPFAFQAAVDLHKADDVKFCILGDTINYEPDPIASLQILKKLADDDLLLKDIDGRIAVVLGNHEEAWLWCENFLGNKFVDILNSNKRNKAIMQAVPDLEKKYLEDHFEIMNKHALAALLITMIKMYDTENNVKLVEWYRQLIDSIGIAPMKCVVNGWNLILAHSDMENVIYRRELNPCEALKADAYIRRLKIDQKIDDRVILLHGHTHIPMYYEFEEINTTEDRVKYDKPIESKADVTIINPGSIGQPRDRDIRPALAILEFGDDTKQFTTTFYRLDLQPEDRYTYLDALRSNRLLEEVLYIAEYAPLPSEVDNESGIQLFRNRAGKHFIERP